MIPAVNMSYQLPHFRLPRLSMPDFPEGQNVTLSRGFLPYPCMNANDIETLRQRQMCYSELLGSLDAVDIGASWANCWSLQEAANREIALADRTGVVSDHKGTDTVRISPQKPTLFYGDRDRSLHQRNDGQLDYQVHHSPGSSTSSEGGSADNMDSKKAFTCPQCKYVTDRKNNLKRHIMTMHLDCDRNLECCSITFRSKAALREHVSLFHKNGYRCGTCGRNFCRKALLRRHLTVHSGRKDFHCNICDYATSHKSNLERHQKVHSKGPLSLRTTWKFRRLSFLPRQEADGLCSVDQQFKFDRLNKMAAERKIKHLQKTAEVFPNRFLQAYEEMGSADEEEEEEEEGDEEVHEEEEENEEVRVVDDENNVKLEEMPEKVETESEQEDKYLHLSCDSTIGIEVTNADVEMTIVPDHDSITEIRDNCTVGNGKEDTTEERDDSKKPHSNGSDGSIRLDNGRFRKDRAPKRLFLRPYRCSQCTESFSSQNLLNHHVCSNEAGTEEFSAVAYLGKSRVK